MANWDHEMMTPTLTTSPAAGSGVGPSLAGAGGGNVGASHHGLIGLVLLSVLTLCILDKVGYRFFVTAGKR